VGRLTGMLAVSDPVTPRPIDETAYRATLHGFAEMIRSNGGRPLTDLRGIADRLDQFHDELAAARERIRVLDETLRDLALGWQASAELALSQNYPGPIAKGVTLYHCAEHLLAALVTPAPEGEKA